MGTFSFVGDVRYMHIVEARARIVPSSTRIQLSLLFMIIVIWCNAVKLAVMVWVLFREHSDFIVTLGDAAESYLRQPEPTTERMCAFSKEVILSTIESDKVNYRKRDMLGDLLQDIYGSWKKEYRTYSASLDRDREIGSYFM